tara:strand:+ start:458 stop:811 length:354 start_codon:yes stop_codon:yes gene_type:complete
MNTTDSLITIEKEKKEIEPKSRSSVSAELKALEQEHRFKIEDDRYKDTWVSCCMVLDRRAVMYFTQIAIIGGTMGFCIAQLYRNETCEGQQAYLGLLTMLIGILIPNPKFNDNNSAD